MSFALAIVHYHLNRGGVMQTMANHLRALSGAEDRPSRVAILYGGQRFAWPDDLQKELAGLKVTLCPIDGLDYDEGAWPRGHEPDDSLGDSICSALARLEFTPDRTVVHVHNHALGKNVSLPGALQELAERGFALLLQVHDFAEDFRPDNYRRMAVALCKNDAAALPALLYPQAEHIHYAVLNSRDEGVFSSAGELPARLHVLPNPVGELGPLASREEVARKLKERFGVREDRRFVLYPVRGIRRKNLGEALLWSALLRDRADFALTLAPVSPDELPSYRRWRATAEKLWLPFAFGVGESGGLQFHENLAAADRLLTTSVAEGFGMVFLESWLADKPLVGRDLPEITCDFAAQGLRLDGLQPRLDVPVQWVGADQAAEHFAAAYRGALAAYSCPPADDLDASVRALFSQERIDFARLDAALQERVLRMVCDSKRTELLKIHPWIERAVFAENEELATHNAAAVRRFASLEACGRRLGSIYRRLLEARREKQVTSLDHGERILSAFLDVARFHPLRVES